MEPEEEKTFCDEWNNLYDHYAEGGIMGNRNRLTAEQRAAFKKEREALVGSLIAQRDEFCAALVLEHVRGSQYRVRLANGREVFASHKKRVEGKSGLSTGGWRVWRD